MTPPQPETLAAPPSHPLAASLIFGAAGLAVLGIVGAVALLDLPFWLPPILVMAACAGLVIILDVRVGLCAVAFSIGPLGIIQTEIASITVSLPELLILTLFAKECCIFVLRDERPRPELLWRSLLFYGLAGLVAIATGFLRGNGAVAVLQDFRQFTEYILLFLLVLHRVKTRNEMIAILLAWIAGCLVIAAHGILQRYTGIGIPATQLVSDQVYHQGVRSGSFYGATPLGALMVLGLGPTLGLILGLRNKLLPAMLLIGAGVLVTAAVFTYTRASWLAIAVLLVFIFISIRKTPAMVSGAVILAILFSAALGPMVVKRLSTLEVSRTESSLLDRVNYYTTAWHIFRAHPVLGLGWGAYYDNKVILLNKRYVPVKEPRRPAHAAPVHPTVHSAYLQLVVKTGALGLVAFGTVLLGWALWLFRAWRRKKGRDEYDFRLFIGTSGALIGYLFHSTFENFFQWPIMSQIFWLLMGLSLVMAGQLAREGRFHRTREEAARS